MLVFLFLQPNDFFVVSMCSLQVENVINMYYPLCLTMHIPRWYFSYSSHQRHVLHPSYSHHWVRPPWLVPVGDGRLWHIMSCHSHLGFHISML